MKNRKKRKARPNRVMGIRVLLASDPHFLSCTLERADPITPEELILAGKDPSRVGHLRALNNFCTEKMGEDIISVNGNRVTKKRYCIHAACACCPAIMIHCKSMIDWQGMVIQQIGNDPMQPIIEIQSPADMTPDWYNTITACPSLMRRRILTKDETIRLVSSVIAMTLFYYIQQDDREISKGLGAALASVKTEWKGDKRWQSEYDLFLLENFA